VTWADQAEDAGEHGQEREGFFDVGSFLVRTPPCSDPAHAAAASGGGWRRRRAAAQSGALRVSAVALRNARNDVLLGSARLDRSIPTVMSNILLPRQEKDALLQSLEGEGRLHPSVRTDIRFRRRTPPSSLTVIEWQRLLQRKLSSISFTAPPPPALAPRAKRKTSVRPPRALHH